MSFCENLFQKNKQIALHWKVNEKWGNQISFEPQPLNELTYQSIGQSMVYVFITHRLGSMLREIIKETYYFTDRHEVEKIHELAEWIVIGDDSDAMIIRDNKHPTQLLRAIFLRHIRNTQTIHFDSIVQFGMKVFKADLIHYVGLAIDEFKREEEHQAFINTVREYVIKKEPNIPLIHVLEGNPFRYYSESGRLLSKFELHALIKKEPLYLIGLPQDEWNLAPLVAMAPKAIKMYVGDSSDPQTQTVINVFQERVTVHSSSDFPYSFLSERK